MFFKVATLITEVLFEQLLVHTAMNTAENEAQWILHMILGGGGV